jgi:hypothetical protein
VQNARQLVLLNEFSHLIAKAITPANFEARSLCPCGIGKSRIDLPNRFTRVNR